jgi:hypothetical protein
MTIVALQQPDGNGRTRHPERPGTINLSIIGSVGRDGLGFRQISRRTKLRCGHLDARVGFGIDRLDLLEARLSADSNRVLVR